MSASLTYYIFEGVLAGVAAGHVVQIRALSGGGAGSTKHGGNADANNPYSQGLMEKDHDEHRGGPIPAGRYKIAAPRHNGSLGLSAALDPYDDAQKKQMYGRSGFYIHGRGPLGSDGCIVPMESFHDLMDWLAKDRGGVLFVLEAMGGERFA